MASFIGNLGVPGIRRGIRHDALDSFSPGSYDYTGGWSPSAGPILRLSPSASPYAPASPAPAAGSSPLYNFPSQSGSAPASGSPLFNFPSGVASSPLWTPAANPYPSLNFQSAAPRTMPNATDLYGNMVPGGLVTQDPLSFYGHLSDLYSPKPLAVASSFVEPEKTTVSPN